MDYKKIPSWLNSIGIPILIITTTINLGMSIYERNVEKNDQKELLLFSAEIAMQKEQIDLQRKNHLYILGEVEKLSYYQFDISQFYSTPKGLQVEVIEKYIQQSFNSYQINYIIYQRVKALLNKEIVDEIDSFLSLFRLGRGVISKNYPIRLNANDMVENGIGYAHYSAFVIKKGIFDKIEANEKFGINLDYSNDCPADLFNVLNEFPYFLLRKINSQTILNIRKK